MKVLIIGAGAVGQIYGYFLQRAGADVSFFVKEKYAKECRQGFPLHRLRPFRAPRSEHFDGAHILTKMDEVAAQEWDQVWLCISSTAMRGDWLTPMLEAINGAILVSLQPGLEEPTFLKKRYPEDQIVFGAIAFVSYQAPLEGESLERSVAYWLPPLSTSPFSGPSDSVKTIVQTLRKGGCPANVHADAAQWSAVPTAIMMPLLAALEANSWSFPALRNSTLLATASAASQQAIQIVAIQTGTKPPFLSRLIKPWFMRCLLLIAPIVAPFDLETYIRYHFTKVGDQTRYLLRDYVAKGQRKSQAVDALEALEEAAWSS